MIDERADIHPSAILGKDVEVGPWSVIGPNVTIGEGTRIASHVVIRSNTRIGCHNDIFQFTSLGEQPQDKKFHGEDTYLEIGDHNIIREFATLHRGTGVGGGITRIGDHNLIMNYVHIAHDCIVNNHTIFSNNASLAGHVIVEDHVIMGGMSGVHQFCTIGTHSFVAKATIVAQDVLPYVLVAGHEAKACGLNSVGLKRRGFSFEVRQQLRRAYKIIYRQGLTVTQALKELEPLGLECPEVQQMLDQLSRSSRGIVR